MHKLRHAKHLQLLLNYVGPVAAAGSAFAMLFALRYEQRNNELALWLTTNSYASVIAMLFSFRADYLIAAESDEEAQETLLKASMVLIITAALAALATTIITTADHELRTQIYCAVGLASSIAIQAPTAGLLASRGKSTELLTYRLLISSVYFVCSICVFKSSLAIEEIIILNASACLMVHLYTIRKNVSRLSIAIAELRQATRKMVAMMKMYGLKLTAADFSSSVTSAVILTELGKSAQTNAAEYGTFQRVTQAVPSLLSASIVERNRHHLLFHHATLAEKEQFRRELLVSAIMVTVATVILSAVLKLPMNLYNFLLGPITAVARLTYAVAALELYRRGWGLYDTVQSAVGLISALVIIKLTDNLREVHLLIILQLIIITISAYTAVVYWKNRYRTEHHQASLYINPEAKGK